MGMDIEAGISSFINQLKWQQLPIKRCTENPVICCLSFKPFISTRFYSFQAIVQEEEGTRLRPVWYQLKIKSIGISSIITVSMISCRKAAFTLWNCSTGKADLVVPFVFQKFIWYNNDLAHDSVRLACPPNSINLAQHTAGARNDYIYRLRDWWLLNNVAVSWSETKNGGLHTCTTIIMNCKANSTI